MSGGLFFLALLTALPVRQTPHAKDVGAAASEAASITGAEFAAWRAALLADSMRGPTPSAAVDRAARYVAAQLRTFGLSVPTVTDTGQGQGFALDRDRYANGIHRYPVPGQLRVDYRRSVLKFVTALHADTCAILTEEGGQRERSSEIALTVALRVLDTVVAPNQISSVFDYLPMPGTLIAGPHTMASLRALDLRRRLVVYVPPAGQDSLPQAALIQDLEARSGGVVVLGAADSATFATRQRKAETRPPTILPFPRSTGSWAVEIWPRAMDDVFRLNGIDVTTLRAVAAPIVRPLPFVTAHMKWSAVSVADTVTAPNVVAVVAGNDSSLTREYVAIQVPLDDGAGNGSEAATSMAGLLALAKAFVQPGAQPRRPLVFLATSGSVGQWGSRYFLSSGLGSTVPVSALTLDLRHLLGDTLFVDGGQEVQTQPAPAWIAALHPDLGVTVTDTGSVLTNETASAFTDRWLPTLALRAGAAGGKDTAVAARTLQLLFHTIRALANSGSSPRWTAVARRRLSASQP